MKPTEDKVQTESLKGTICPYHPIRCQEGWCAGCQIYIDHRGGGKREKIYKAIKKHREDCIDIITDAVVEALIEQARPDKDMTETINFAGKIARAMDDLRSSHVFFIIQQAYGNDMEWEDAQLIFDTVKDHTKS